MRNFKALEAGDQYTIERLVNDALNMYPNLVIIASGQYVYRFETETHMPEVRYWAHLAERDQ